MAILRTIRPDVFSNYLADVRQVNLFTHWVPVRNKNPSNTYLGGNFIWKKWERQTKGQIKHLASTSCTK